MSLIYQRQTCPRSMNTASGLLFRQTQEDFSKKVEYCEATPCLLTHSTSTPTSSASRSCRLLSVQCSSVFVCLHVRLIVMPFSVTRHQYLLPLVETIELGSVLGNELYKSHYYHEIRTGAGIRVHTEKRQYPGGYCTGHQS